MNGNKGMSDNTPIDKDEPEVPQFPIDRIELDMISDEDIQPDIPNFPIDRLEKGQLPEPFQKEED